MAWGPNIGFVVAKVCTPTFFGLNAECPSSALAAGITWAVDPANPARLKAIVVGLTALDLATTDAVLRARAIAATGPSPRTSEGFWRAVSGGGGMGCSIVVGARLARAHS